MSGSVQAAMAKTTEGGGELRSHIRLFLTVLEAAGLRSGIRVGSSEALLQVADGQLLAGFTCGVERGQGSPLGSFL